MSELYPYETLFRLKLNDFYQNILKELRNFKRMHPEIPDDEPIFSYLDDKMPGEDVIVRRMIWEIVHKSKYHQYIADDHILLFEENQKTNIFVTSEIDEAIFLADNLVILSNKPTTVQTVIKIDLPRPRNYKMLTTAKAFKYRKQAMELLHGEAMKSFAVAK